MTLHTKLSYAKSALRIIGAIILLFSANTILILAGAFIGGAELLGIAEEAWPGAYEGTKTV